MSDKKQHRASDHGAPNPRMSSPDAPAPTRGSPGATEQVNPCANELTPRRANNHTEPDYTPRLDWDAFTTWPKRNQSARADFPAPTPHQRE